MRTIQPEEITPGSRDPNLDGTVSSEYFFDFSALLRGIKRDIWLIAAIILICSSVATYYAFVIASPIYRAGASLVLDSSDFDAADLPGENTSKQISETELNTNIAILLSNDLLKRVIDRLDLLDDPEFNPFAGQDLNELSETDRIIYESNLTNFVASGVRQSMTARNIQQTFIIRVTATTSSPVKSQEIANTLVDAYLERQVEQKREAARTATDWLRERVNELQGDVIEAERRIDAFNAERSSNTTQSGLTLRALVEQSRAIDEQYQYFLNRLAEASAQEGIYRPDGRVLSYATAPLRPLAPRKRLIVFAGVMVGLALALALTSYRAYMSGVIRSRNALEAATPLSLLGVLPKSGRSLRRSKHGTLFEARSKAYKARLSQLVGNLLVLGKGRRGLLQAITSCNADEGKTSTIQSLARSYADNGRSVLLIDADLRKCSLSQHLLPGGANGLMDLYEGKATLDEALVSLDHKRVQFLGCTQIVGQPIDLLYSDTFHAALDEAKEKFDVILVDTGPVLANVDLAAFGDKCDAIVFIVRENHTTQRQLKLALNKLRHHQLKVSGILMTMANRRTLSDWQQLIY